MNHIVAIVGMTGSGKSELTRLFTGRGYHKVRFGDLTEEELRKRGMPQNAETERIVREDLRAKHGMGVFAILNAERIDVALAKGNVVVDGLYSWAEYLSMAKRYGARLIIVAVYSSPRTRYARLAKRAVRPLTTEEATRRDYAEIEHIQKAGPIAMADYSIVNEGDMTTLEKGIEDILRAMGTP